MSLLLIMISTIATTNFHTWFTTLSQFWTYLRQWDVGTPYMTSNITGHTDRESYTNNLSVSVKQGRARIILTWPLKK